MRTIDLVVIGGGSAGMAAALQARKEGIQDILILEKEDSLGGILTQCIHNGFGLTEFKEELTGPEYLQRFVDQVVEEKIPYECGAQVLDLSRDKVITYSKDGKFETLQAKAIVMATGCYERSAGAIQTPGDRCSGIITAGAAQKYCNIKGYMVGKRVVILGSGDIGLIMARRLTLEGAKVICVSEIMPYSAGLNRNIQQCLKDYDIPLYLSRSVSRTIGKDRLEKVILSAVDEKMSFIPGTEMEIECDTLVLSVGLIPYISLLNNIDCPTSSTKGAVVNNYMETMIDGIFSCGNCLHVHDVVDFVTDEGRTAGHGAALYLQNKIHKENDVNTVAGNGVSYVVPQFINKNAEENVTLKLRVRTPLKDQWVLIKSGGNVIQKVFKSAVIPSEMLLLTLSKDKLSLISDDLTFELEGK
ncbi:MAG: FAD-dependent oxidoreductase [Bacilli bacterium]|nr:FAD-dependent oxidoreductase [Bacilli bacterium]